MDTEKAAPRRIFLSYGHDEHAELGQKLYDDLKQGGYEVWFDRAAIEPGMNWMGRIEEGIDWVSQGPGGGHVILLMTPHSTCRPNGYCLNEIELAKRRRLSILPVMVVMVEVPFAINTIQYLDMTDCVPLADKAGCYQRKWPLLLKVIEGGPLDFEGRQSRLQRALRPLDLPDLCHHLRRFTGRKWLIGKIQAWIAAPDAARAFWLTGGPGSGKSALAAWLGANSREVAAFHVCQHAERATADPPRVVKTIAWQLTTQLPDYLERLSAVPNLEEICEEASAETLFDKLIVQPIHDLPLPDRRILILIDGLDEATERRANKLALFLAGEIPKLPDWARLLITSRPEIEVEQPLQTLDPVTLAADSPENTADMIEFIERFLKQYAPGGQLSPDDIEQILIVSEKNWLYLEWLLKELQENRLALTNIDRFPRGLGGVYAQFFARQFPDLDEYGRHGRPLLELVAAACEPLPADYAGEVLGWSTYDADDAADGFGALLARDGGAIRLFHKSLLDWLADRSLSGYYRVSAAEGHKKLAEHGWNKYSRGVESLSEYMAKYLPVHLGESKSRERLFACITDAGYIFRASATGSHYALAQFWKQFDLARIRQACEASFAKQVQNQERAFRMSLCLGQLFLHDGRLDDAIAYFSRALAAASALDAGAAGQAHLNLGWCLRHQEHYEQALGQVERAAELFAGTDNQAGLAAALSVKGLCLWHQYNVSASLESAGRAVKLFEQLKDHRGHAEALNHIGIVYRSIGQYEEALENLHAAESIYRGLRDDKDLGKCLNSLGTACWWSGQRQQALQYYAEANRLNEKMDQQYILGLTATNLGYVYLELGDLPKSLEWFERGRQIRSDIMKTKAYEMMDVSGMARVHFQMGNLERARELSRQAVETLARCETVEDLSWAYYNHYVILSGGNDQERREAQDALSQARAFVERWLATIADPALRDVAIDKVPLVREILGGSPGGQPFAVTATPVPGQANVVSRNPAPE